MLGISPLDARGGRGSASVEHVGLVALLAATVLATIVVLGTESGGSDDRSLATTLSRKIRCAASGPGPCWRDPLTVAYGRSLAGAVRALAATPSVVQGPTDIGLVGVDFRRCRQPSCAIPASGAPDERLTTANRRISVFTSVEDNRHAGEPVRISYWVYRPGTAWEQTVREVSTAEVSALAGTPLLERSNPKLIPLETLPGRNHVSFAAVEEPPWRWKVGSVVGG